MTDFFRIGTDQPAQIVIPDVLELPIYNKDPIPNYTTKIVKPGDPDYEESLVRWMFLRGYCTKEANEREMTETLPQEEG